MFGLLAVLFGIAKRSHLTRFPGGIQGYHGGQRKKYRPRLPLAWWEYSDAPLQGKDNYYIKR